MCQDARVYHHLVHAALEFRQLLHEALQPGSAVLPWPCAILRYSSPGFAVISCQARVRASV